MNHASPRSLKLLEDIINGAETENGDVFVEGTPNGAVNRKTQNMSEEGAKDVSETVNFFENLLRKKDPLTNGDTRQNGDVAFVENGIQEDHLQGIAEESEDESYTITEVSETTDSRTVDTSSSSNIQRRKCRNRKTLFTKRDKPPVHQTGKTSSVQEGSSDRESLSDFAETMSDSGRVGRRQRKLRKREQMRAFRPITVEPLETAEERLERKYEELQGLLTGQFSERTTALGENHIKQMELLRQQYAIASHGLPPSGIIVPRSMPAEFRQNGFQRHHPANKENHNHGGAEDEAYTTIRTLQTTKAGQRKSRSRAIRTRPLSASRQNQSRSTSRDRKKQTLHNDNNKRRDNRDVSSEERQQKSKSRSRSNSRSRSSSGSPRRMYLPTETHLKNTENELIKDWLKKKDIECRQRKAEERRKKKQERKEKIEKQIEKEEKFKESKKVVQDWMRQKKKEAFHKKKDKKEFEKEEAARKAYERAKRVSGIHGWKVGQSSSSAPLPTEDGKPRISRPGTTVEEVQAKEEERLRQIEENNRVGSEVTQQEVPQPPVTKYVYRRPVLGKVRLRVKPQTPVSARSPTRRQEKPLTKEQIAHKQRMSYDEWLEQKKKNDVDKKQAQVAQSQPNFEVPVPELQQKGQKNVLQGRAISPGGSGPRSPQRTRILNQEEQEQIRERTRKKKEIDSLISYEETVFDLDSVSPEEALERVAKNVVTYVLSSLSDEENVEEPLFVEDEDEAEHEGLANLSVSGSKATFSTRPMSASNISVPAPQTSKSPRRPMSAQNKLKSPSSSFEGQLPFPPDVGAPGHVQRVQKKLFPERVWVNPEGDERPEPQGADAFEPIGEPRQERLFGTSNGTSSAEDEGFVSNVTPGQEPNSESLSSSKKHVSFCEETTIFDEESDIEEDLDDWNDEPPPDPEDLEQARNLILDLLPNESEQKSIFITGSEA